MELEYALIAIGSCRDTATMLNRIRIQNDGAKATTVRNQVEREGTTIDAAMSLKAELSFASCGFEADGHKKPETIIDFSEAQLQTADHELITEAAKELGVVVSIDDYEAVDCAVNISIDEVCSKHQVSKRPCPDRKKEAKQVRNTVIHVQKGCSSYLLVGKTITEAVKLLIGFMLTNDLIGLYPLIFFADGAKNIKTVVAEYFGFIPYKYILDWPHLAKKSAELLSSAIRGKDRRNEVHE
jgi:hypothetical protein